MTVPLTNLRAFDAVARLLSFTKASAELHLSQSAVSQQIAQFEERLGFKLFRRLTRRLELTENGRKLYETIRSCIRDIDDTIATLQDVDAEVSVTISVGSSFAVNWLIPRLADFGIDCPGIDLRIKPSDSLIDLPSDPSIDIAVRFAQDPGQGFVTKSLEEEQVFVVCSPSLLGGRTSLENMQDLSAYPLLHSEVSDNETGAAGNWENWLAAIGQKNALDTRLGPRVPRSDLLVQAAIHGQGMALVWTTMVRGELSDGRLIKVFNGHYEMSSRYYVTCTEDAFAKPMVRSVIEWMTGKAIRQGP